MGDENGSDREVVQEKGCLGERGYLKESNRTWTHVCLNIYIYKVLAEREYRFSLATWDTNDHFHITPRSSKPARYYLHTK